MHFVSLALASLVLLILSLYIKKVLHASQSNPSNLPFPPGPPPLPLIGNLRQLPKTQQWLTYTRWGREYGPLVHASAPGQHIIIVNSLKVTTDLFEQRGHIYSDRLVYPMLELMGWDFALGLMPYDPKWKRYRRVMEQHFRKDSTRNYRPVQRQKIRALLGNLLSTPQDFREHVKILAAAIIMSTVYGYDVESIHDPFIALVENAVRKLGEASFPGAVAVNMFPVLRHLPGWLPGCGFQRFAADTRALTLKMQYAPFEYTKQNMMEGKDSNSIVAKMLEDGEVHLDHEAIREIAAISYSAGADTTSAALSSFFVAMAMFPAVQRKAQDEIDTVVGSLRLPEYQDRPQLVYAEALYREIMRWRPMAPLNLIRSTTEDDVYEGYFIPKGATIISNIWAMTRDESVYQKPEEFMPERFLTADGKLNDDPILAYGFGRRICVGRHAADDAVWATIVSVLSVFNIAKAKDVDGNEINIDLVYTEGLISHPKLFQCAITARSAAAEGLIRATDEEGP